MRNCIILTDTRQQKEKHIIKAFDKNEVIHIQTKLDAGDYMAVRYGNNGFYIDHSTIIDTKKDLLEMCGNLCHSEEHQRIIREVDRAHEMGCNNFIFLIGENKIKNQDDIRKWSNRNTKVTGETLLKVMKTFKDHHNCKFIIVPHKEMGKTILDILDKQTSQNNTQSAE